MRLYLLILSLLISLRASATAYYVSPTGDNANSGLTPLLPKASATVADRLTAPGDTVFFLAGEYTQSNANANIVDIYNSGTAGRPIVYTNYRGQQPILRARNWNGIAVQGADYIEIYGLEVIGNAREVTLAYAQAQQSNFNNPITSCNGISIVRQYNHEDNRPHHVYVHDCTVRLCPGGGISTYWADYVTIERNIIDSCSFYAPYACSGISFYQNWNSDSATGIKMIVRGNISSHNYNFIPFTAGGFTYITDGNGIIIDDARQTQNNSPLSPYKGTTLVENNVLYRNGGRGVNVYSSDRVVVRNNTSFHNSRHPDIRDAEIVARDADSVCIYSNIAVSLPGVPPIKARDTTRITGGYNVVSGATALGLHFPHQLAATDVLFADTTHGDFHLYPGSPAIGAGSPSQHSTTDFNGTQRAAATPSAGAFEFSAITEELSTIKYRLRIYPNPGQGWVVVEGALPKTGIQITNLQGKLMLDMEAINGKVDVRSLAPGTYILSAGLRHGRVILE